MVNAEQHAVALKHATKERPFPIYIGYDSHEAIVHDVCRHSIRRRTALPLDIISLKQKDFRERGIFWRTRDPKQSTEFTYLRFLVPYLNNYKGWAMFVDDDFVFLRDIAELFDHIDDKYAIMCVHHDYSPKMAAKLAHVLQESYPRKNWSSCMLMKLSGIKDATRHLLCSNCGHPANQALTLDVVNRESGSYLHRFSWITDDSLIGEIPYIWNFLTPWYKKLPEGELPGAVHYTTGGPWFPDYREDETTEYKEEWLAELKHHESLLPKTRELCPFERFSTQGKTALPGYPNSKVAWTWAEDVDVHCDVVPALQVA